SIPDNLRNRAESSEGYLLILRRLILILRRVSPFSQKNLTTSRMNSPSVDRAATNSSMTELHLADEAVETRPARPCHSTASSSAGASGRSKAIETLCLFRLPRTRAARE